MDNSFWLVLGIGVLIVAAVAVVSYYQDQKRVQELRAVAARHGFQFDQDGAGLAISLGGFALFDRGHSRKATNLLSTRVAGAAAHIMDYRYEVSAGKSRTIYKQSVLLLESEQLDLPAFALRPEGLGQKLSSLLGQQDIDFEAQPGFSSAYVLQGPAEGRIRALFQGEKLAFFAHRPGLCVEGQGQRLLYYRANRLVSPEAIPSFLEEGLSVLRLLAREPAPLPAIEPDLLASEAPPPPASEPDPLAGLDEVLAELGIEDSPVGKGQ